MPPKYPAPKSASRRLRASRESTRMSMEVTDIEHMDFDAIEREIEKFGRDGVLMVNGRPGSAVSVGGSRWDDAMQAEWADEEMLDAFCGQTPAPKLLDSVDIDEDEEIIEIKLMSDTIETVITPTNEEPNVVVEVPEESERKPKSRPSSSRPLSARKKSDLDSLKKTKTKSVSQWSKEYGTHRLSTTPSKELTKAVTKLSTQLKKTAPSTPPKETKSIVKSKTTIEVEPEKESTVANFLLMGVDKPEETSETPRRRHSKPDLMTGKSYTGNLFFLSLTFVIG